MCARTWVEGATDHAREDDEDERQHLQICGQNGCSLHMTHALSRQRSLHNHLHVEERRLENEKCFRIPSHINSLSLSLSFVFFQLFPAARSPGRNERPKEAKVVIAKRGFHCPTGASGPMIGGHRYGQIRSGTRSGRSPRRHSPSSRNIQHTSSMADASGLLGISLSKLNLKYLKGRGGASQKRATQSKRGSSVEPVD